MNNPYIAHTWTDRRSQYRNRRRITNTADPEDVKQVYVERDEGEVTVQGDAYTSENWNAMEARINDAFQAVTVGKPETLTGSTDPTAQDGRNGDTYYKTETEGGETSVVAVFVKISGAWLPVATGGAALPQAEGSEF